LRGERAAKMANRNLLDQLLSPEQAISDQRAAARARLMQGLLVILMLILTMLWLWGFIWAYNQPRIRNMEIRDAHIVGADAVCPGDRLIIAYDFHAEGSGLLEVDSSLWAVDPPPRTIIYSASRRFVMAETIDQEIVEAWTVPSHYVDFATGDEVTLAPGTYRRDIAVSAPVRGSVLTTASVAFTIRKDCPPATGGTQP